MAVMSFKRSFKKFGLAILFATSVVTVGVLGSVFYAYQIQSVDWQELKDALVPLPPLTSLSHFIAESEALVQLRPGNEKKIIWAGGEQKKADLSLVYLHGFSASPREISPVLEQVSEALQANVYFARFPAHGGDGENFNKLTVEDFLKEGIQALRIGNLLGRRCVVVAMSTGATVASLLSANLDQLHLGIDGVIFLSPNFSLLDPASSLLAGPLGPWMARLVLGKYRDWQPSVEEQRFYWNTHYRSEGLAAMMNVVALNSRVQYHNVKFPSLTFMTKADDVIDIEFATEKIRTMPRYSIEWVSSEHHVLTGGIVSPQTVEKVKARMIQFLQTEI